MYSRTVNSVNAKKYLLKRLFLKKCWKNVYQWCVATTSYNEANRFVLVFLELYRRIPASNNFAVFWILRPFRFRWLFRLLWCYEFHLKLISREIIEEEAWKKQLPSGSGIMPFALSSSSFATLLWFGLHTVSVTTPSAFFRRLVACEKEHKVQFKVNDSFLQ